MYAIRSYYGIQCTRCLRACREAQVNNVIGYAERGAASHIVFDLDDSLGESSCVACGECVQACPTGALMPARGLGLERTEKHRITSYNVCYTKLLRHPLLIATTRIDDGNRPIAHHKADIRNNFV